MSFLLKFAVCSEVSELLILFRLLDSGDCRRVRPLLDDRRSRDNISVRSRTEGNAFTVAALWF